MEMIYFGTRTEIIIYSTLDIEHSLESRNQVSATCRERCASTYINSIGGCCLYDRDVLEACEINLFFVKPDTIQYEQFNNHFVPRSSFIDVMMSNPRETNSHCIN